MFSKAFTKKPIIFYLFLILLSQLSPKAAPVQAYANIPDAYSNTPSNLASNNLSLYPTNTNYASCGYPSHASQSYGCVHPNYPQRQSGSSISNIIRQALQIIASVLNLFINSLFGGGSHYQTPNYYANAGGSYGDYAGYSSGLNYGQSNYGYGYGQPEYNGNYGYPYSGYEQPAYYGNYGYPNYQTNINNGNSSGFDWGSFAGSAAGTLLGGLFSNSGSTTNNYNTTQFQQTQNNNYLSQQLFAQQNNTNLAYNSTSQYYPETEPLFGTGLQVPPLTSVPTPIIPEATPPELIPIPVGDGSSPIFLPPITSTPTTDGSLLPPVRAFF